MKMNRLFIPLFLMLVFASCKEKQEAIPTEEVVEAVKETFKFWTWITADASRTDSSYLEEFEKMRSAR